MRNVEMPSPTPEEAERRLPTRTKEDVARLGKEIYERDIRRRVDAAHVGEVVSIDVETGSWAIGDDVLEAADRLQEQRPGAVNIWSERIGYRTLASLGGGSLQRTE